MTSIRRQLQIKFVTGLLVIVPIAVTVWTFWELFTFVDGLLAPVVADRLGRRVPGVGLLVAILLVLLMGVFATNVVGRRTLAWLDSLLYRIPIFRNVLRGEAPAECLLTRQPGGVQGVVLVPNQEKGRYSFGFLTGEVALQRGSGETEPLVAVYVPTNHLYLGDILLVRREDIIQTRLTIPQGIQIVLSGGISIPQILRQKLPDPDRR
jgi:uncharacterized membrane protein